MAATGVRAGAPILGIGCLALVLFIIAATIVLALIPVYLSTKQGVISSLNIYQRRVPYSVGVPSGTPTGALSSSELQTITNYLLNSQSTSTLKRGGLSALSGNIGAGGKRQISLICSLIVLIFGQTPAAVNNIFLALNLFILGNPSGLSASVVQATLDRTTTVPATTSAGATTTTVAASTTAAASTAPSTTGSASTAASGRRRRREGNQESATSPPLVTYED